MLGLGIRQPCIPASFLAAVTARGLGSVRQKPGRDQRPAKQKLDLGIETPELGIRPSLQRLVSSRVKPKEKCIFLRHTSDCTFPGFSFPEEL